MGGGTEGREGWKVGRFGEQRDGGMDGGREGGREGREGQGGEGVREGNGEGGSKQGRWVEWMWVGARQGGELYWVSQLQLYLL